MKFEYFNLVERSRKNPFYWFCIKWVAANWA